MKIGILFGAIGVLMAAIAVLAALNLISVPSLEDPACDVARDATKRFYSYHFGDDLTPSADYLRKREQYLSSRLRKKLAGEAVGPTDYFTATADYPRAFRIGACRAIAPEEVEFEVVLFWKDDVRSEQRSVTVRSVSESGKWLVDEVRPTER